MEHKNLGAWISWALVGMIICVTLIYFFLMPQVAKSFVYSYPEFSSWYWPWIYFLWATAIPCYTVMYYLYKIQRRVKDDSTFSDITAIYMKNIAALIFLDVAFFFTGNIVLFLFNMNHPGILFCSLIINVIGIVIGLAVVVLSRFIKKASILQEENDGMV